MIAWLVRTRTQRLVVVRGSRADAAQHGRVLRTANAAEVLIAETYAEVCS